MKRLAVRLLVCWLALLTVTSSLNVEEEEPLRNLLERFPTLLNVNPIQQYQYKLAEDLDWGGSWHADVSQLCSGGSGWQVHGIKCDGAGHVSEIRLYAPLSSYLLVTEH